MLSYLSSIASLCKWYAFIFLYVISWPTCPRWTFWIIPTYMFIYNLHISISMKNPYIYVWIYMCIWKYLSLYLHIFVPWSSYTHSSLYLYKLDVRSQYLSTLSLTLLVSSHLQLLKEAFLNYSLPLVTPCFFFLLDT